MQETRHVCCRFFLEATPPLLSVRITRRVLFLLFRRKRDGLGFRLLTGSHCNRDTHQLGPGDVGILFAWGHPSSNILKKGQRYHSVVVDIRLCVCFCFGEIQLGYNHSRTPCDCSTIIAPNVRMPCQLDLDAVAKKEIRDARFREVACMSGLVPKKTRLLRVAFHEHKCVCRCFRFGGMHA